MSPNDESQPTGKPPKSDAEIRNKLQAIQKTADVQHASGPMRDGMTSSHQILIASFHNRKLAKTLQRLLGQHGIFCDDQIRNHQIHISVDYEDSEKAARLATDFRSKNPDPIPASRKRRFELPVLCVILACVVAFCVSDFEKFQFESGVFLLLSAGIGACVGILLDRIFRSVVAGTFLFGIFEVLVVIALIALTLVMFEFLQTVLDGQRLKL